MIARLHIQTAARNGITYLKQGYCTPPFKIADITEDKRAGILRLMLMSASPGILDGDDYHLKFEIAAHCQVQLQTQSYQRLFNMRTGAVQQMEVYMHENASLVYIPHPTVPHQRSIFTARNNLYLHNNSELVWGEILTCGRKLNGEQFSFSKYHSITNIYVNGQLTIKENLLVQPALLNVHGIGQWEGYSHQASLIIIQPAHIVQQAITTIREYLEQQTGITFGVSAASLAVIVVRILGYKAEQLYDCLHRIAALAATPSPVTEPTPAPYAG
jgi:urease accessory protein